MCDCEDKKNIDRIWKILGSPTYEQLKGRSIFDLIEGHVKALQDIKRIGDNCHCDKGYPGGCGCGQRCGDIAEDALE